MNPEINDLEPIKWNLNVTKLKQPRVYVLCVCKLPLEQRDKMPAKDVLKAHGAFLLGFNSFPQNGDIFPYQNQMWQVENLIQFPHRYKTRVTKYPAIARLKWLSSFDSIQDVIEDYLDLDSED